MGNAYVAQNAGAGKPQRAKKAHWNFCSGRPGHVSGYICRFLHQDSGLMGSQPDGRSQSVPHRAWNPGIHSGTDFVMSVIYVLFIQKTGLSFSDCHYRIVSIRCCSRHEELSTSYSRTVP